jgi:hypothetical protein
MAGKGMLLQVQVTTAATKPGGLIPKYPAMITATAAAPRAAQSSPFQKYLV